MSRSRRGATAALAVAATLLGSFPGCTTRFGPLEVAPLRAGWTAEPGRRITWRQGDVEVSVDRIPAADGFGGRIVNLGEQTVVAWFLRGDASGAETPLGYRWLGRTRLIDASPIVPDEPIEIPPRDPAVEEPDQWLGFVLSPTRVGELDEVRCRLVAATSEGDLVWPLEFEKVRSVDEYAPPLDFDTWGDFGIAMLLLPLLPLYLVLFLCGVGK